jgi:hypothetical protein
VKYCLFVLIPAALCAQSSTVTINVDINGHRVESAPSVTTTEGDKTILNQSINGRLVPKEQTETRVLSETPTEKVTETFDRKFDQTGQLTLTERTLTTEQKRTDGGTSTNASVYRSDINGGMPEVERRQIETHPQGPGSTESDVTIARPSDNGGLQNVEQRKILTTTGPNSTHEDQTVYLKSTNGDFVARRRTVTDSQKSNDKTEASVANYETDYLGHMALLSSENTTTVVSKDGKQEIERNLYASASDGVARDDQGGQKIKEQQIIVRTPGPDGTVTETVSVRRPTLAEQTHLGPPVQISETVCTGKCDPGKP